MEDKEPEPRFLCDEMLCRLGRWLRAAGYDTVIAEAGQADRQLVEQALLEMRWLLTRDRKMVEFRQARDCVLLLLTGNDVPAQVKEVGRRLPVDWLHAPFSRCLVCNSLLMAADPSRLVEVPEFSRKGLETLYECSGCRRLYWHGSHVRRMHAKLHRWKKLD